MGDPDLEGEWTSEGEFGVPFERPPELGTRRLLTDEEYAQRLEGVRARDERDLAPVDVFSANVEGRNAPIPHWREYKTDSRRTSLVLDGYVVITYELIHDTRIIPLDDERPYLSPAIRRYTGDARGRWDGSTLVVETRNLKATTRGASLALRLVERFTRTSESSIEYEVTFVDPNTWTAPWIAAVSLKARPADAGAYEYACREGNYGMSNMLSAARYLERTQQAAE